MKTVLFAIQILLYTFGPVSAQKNEVLLKPEKIYLHTDRDFYIAGEYLFYTLYLQGNHDQISKYAYLIIRDKNNSFVSNIRLEINNQAAYGSVFLPDTLISGVYQIVCYTNCMRNEGEETYFKKEIVIANRFDEKMDLFTGQINASPSNTSFSRYSDIINTNENLNVHLNKQVFDQREKISFTIESNFIPDDSITHLSVSISELVPGIPVKPSISDYFVSNNKNSYNGKSNQNHSSFIPEFNVSVIQGKVIPVTQSNIEKDSLKTNVTNTVKNYSVLISAPDSIANMQFTTTDSLGSFSFLLDPYYDGKELFVRLKENVNSAIFIDDKYSLIQPFTPSEMFNIPGLKDYMIRFGKIVQFQNFYRKHVTIITEKKFFTSKVIPRIYYKQYSTIFPSDFIELPDFIEISKEIVPSFKVRKAEDKFVSGYINFLDQGRINLEPTIFLDGVPIDNVNQIINLGSSQIKRIESLPVMRFYGEMSFSGILAVFSKDIEINNIQFKTPTIKYQTLSSQSYTKPEPYSPTVNSKHIPDLRQLLLWEPDIILKKDEKQQIECFASDLPGRFQINIQGITSKGYPVNGSAIITIQSKSQ